MRVLIVDDHELFRAGLALLLRGLFPDIELLHASTLSQGMDHALGELLNIVFAGASIPGNIANQLKRSFASAGFLLATGRFRRGPITPVMSLNGTPSWAIP